ncbi:MAG: putative peptidoglycan glycosyltransferase FtsW [Ezakiella sp.]|nr:putative lipid II flippase FtsW [Ezakiella sp.]MDY3946589.1 putative peptidoglycan glycosyltransferase FtsW [Ezakiella sp.]
MRRASTIIYVIVVLLTLLFGITMVYSSSYPYAINEGEKFGNDPNYFLKRQIIFVTIGLVAMTIAFIIPANFYKKMPIVFLLGSLFICTLTFTSLGVNVNGAQRWISLGGITIQPSDFLKLGVALYIPFLLANDKNKKMLPYIMPLAIGVCGAIVYLQQDLGTAILIVAVMAIMYFLTYMSMPEFFVYLAAASGFLYYAIAGTEYRRGRWQAFLNPFSDRLDTGWHAIQSIYAVANGGAIGVGLGNSIQKYGYIYAAYSDYIFSIISEELGMFGGILTIVALLFIGLVPVHYAKKLEDKYMRYFLMTFSLFIILQTLIHVGVVVNAIPAKGITLPLISYGGSSIITYCAFIGVALNFMVKGKYKEA